MSGMDRPFREVWSDYTEDNHGNRVELDVPDDFDRSEWDEVGYIPPERRSDNEVYNWSAFYDFFVWLRSIDTHMDRSE